jgi:hypothetical protein
MLIGLLAAAGLVALQPLAASVLPGAIAASNAAVANAEFGLEVLSVEIPLKKHETPNLRLQESIERKTGKPFSGGGAAGDTGLLPVTTFSVMGATNAVASRARTFPYAAVISGRLEDAVHALTNDGDGLLTFSRRSQTRQTEWMLYGVSHLEEAAYLQKHGTAPPDLWEQLRTEKCGRYRWIEIAPCLAPDGRIDMNLHLEDGSLAYVSIANVGKVPIERNVTDVLAKISVPDGGIVMLGGLINTVKTPRLSRVPVVKHIPGMRSLFGSRTLRSETLVLIRPTILGGIGPGGSEHGASAGI